MSAEPTEINLTVIGSIAVGIYGLAEGIMMHTKKEDHASLVSGMFVTAIKLYSKRYGDGAESLVVRRLIEFKLAEKGEKDSNPKLDLENTNIEDLIKQAANRGGKHG